MENKFVQFNINYHVYVKLKDAGILAYLKHYNKYAPKEEDKLTIPIFMERADSDGYHEFQMHEFMEVFGPYITNTMDFSYFEPTIYFNKHELNFSADPETIKADEHWNNKSTTTTEVNLPDGHYSGNLKGNKVTVEHVVLKGRGSTYSFEVTSDLSPIAHGVKITVKNKRAYVYKK